jgi:hypothetical protein
MEWSITVWDEPRLVYVAVPKAANTAVKAALLTSYVRKQKWRNPHAASMPYVEATKAELFDRYRDHLTFTIVREPFDRFVSFWADKIAGSGWYSALGRQGFTPGMGFEAAAIVAAGLPDETTDPHLRSQSERLTHADGSIVAQLVLRFEDLLADWEALRRIAAARSTTPLASIEARRQSVHLRPDHYFTPRAEEAICERYRADFELLGYPTALGAVAPTGGSALHRLQQLVRERPDVVVIDAAGADPVRRQLVRDAGGVYLARADRDRPEGQITSLAATLASFDKSISTVVLHRAAPDAEVDSLPSTTVRLRVD